MDSTVQRIQYLFENSKMSDLELEEKLNLPRSTIYNWRKGRSKSYQKYLKEISTFFNVSTAFLLCQPPFDAWDILQNHKDEFLDYMVKNKKDFVTFRGSRFKDAYNDNLQFIRFIEETCSKIHIVSETPIFEFAVETIASDSVMQYITEMTSHAIEFSKKHPILTKKSFDVMDSLFGADLHILSKRLNLCLHEFKATAEDIEHIEEQAGLSSGTIANLLSCQSTNIAPIKIAALAETLGVSYNYLAGLDQNVTPTQNEVIHFQKYQALNAEGQRRIHQITEDLLKIDEYRRYPQKK